MIVCPNCKKSLETGSNFCPSCGYDLRGLEVQKAAEEKSEQAAQVQKLEFAVCDICGEETPTVSGYCESCGAKLTGKEEKFVREAGVGNKVRPEDEEKVDNKEKSVKLNNTVGIGGETAKAEPEKKKNVPGVSAGQKQKAKASQSHSAATAGTRKVQKAINPLHIGIYVFALLAVGLVILYMSGVFDSHSDQVQNNVSQSDAPQGQGRNISLEALQRINDLENTVKRDTTNYGNVLELAHMLNDSGFYERAIPYYQIYLRGNPRNADVFVDLGVCYFNIKQYDNAIFMMKKGLNINPRHQIGNFNIGIVNFSAGKIDSAKIWWRKAIEIDPNSEVGKKSKELLDSH